MVANFLQFFIPAVRFQALTFIEQNLDGQGIYMEWEASRDNTSTPDEGEVRLYNLRPQIALTIHELLQTRIPIQGFPCTLSIGWQGVASELMKGDLYDYTPSKRTPTDVISIFRFGDGLKNIRDATVGRTFAGVRIDEALNYLVQLPPSSTDAGSGGLGLFYPAESRALIIAAAAATPLLTLRNIVQGLNTRDAITLLMSTIGLQWRVHNGAFIAMRDAIIFRPGPILRPANGLLEYEKRNDGGIFVEALANPDVEPGIQIVVQDDLGKPVGELLYRVEKVSFRGNTSGESVMSIDAAKSVTV